MEKDNKKWFRRMLERGVDSQNQEKTDGMSVSKEIVTNHKDYSPRTVKLAFNIINKVKGGSNAKTK